MVSSRELRLAELRSYVDKAQRMRGWSFDTQTVGLRPAMPWDYDERARELMLGAKVVLDMGTGEGERFPDSVTATQASLSRRRAGLPTSRWR